ncbi:MAG: hypothetical protein ACYCPE_13640 [Metallibacterium sp.]
MFTPAPRNGDTVLSGMKCQFSATIGESAIVRLRINGVCAKARHPRRCILRKARTGKAQAGQQGGGDQGLTESS